MKKNICALITLALLLCGLAMAEGSVIKPMTPDIDLASPADGTYAVVFAPANLADGVLTFTIYAEDHYDIVDISVLAKGDTIFFGGLDYVVDTVERSDALYVNGGNDNGGFTLQPFEADNCWKVVLDDDYATFTGIGEATLPLADGVCFTDGWDIEKEPLTVSGAEAVTEAIHGTDMDYFAYMNTSLRVEDGKIVEIIRTYMP